MKTLIFRILSRISRNFIRTQSEKPTIPSSLGAIRKVSLISGTPSANKPLRHAYTLPRLFSLNLRPTKTETGKTREHAFPLFRRARENSSVSGLIVPNFSTTLSFDSIRIKYLLFRYYNTKDLWNCVHEIRGALLLWH